MKAKQMAPLLLLAFIWGCYYVASGEAVGGLSVFSAGVIIRFLTMILLLIVMWKKGELKLLLQTKPVLKRLLIIGTLGFLLDATAFVGLSLSSAGSGTALLKMDILFVNIISVFVYKEKFTKRDWFCTFIMLFGILNVMGIDIIKFRFGGKGDVFFVVSALFVAINAFVIKSVQKDKKAPANNNVIAFYNNFITMLYFLITSLMTGSMGQLSALRQDKGLLIAVIFAALGQTLVYVVYYSNLRVYPVWIVKVFLLLMPVVATIVSFVLFGDTMGVKQYIGILIVLLGALGIVLEQKRKARKLEEIAKN